MLDIKRPDTKLEGREHGRKSLNKHVRVYTQISEQGHGDVKDPAVHVQFPYRQMQLRIIFLVPTGQEID